jgi:hypothetical protein
MRITELTQSKRPIAPPMDLNAGRLDVTRAALAGAFVLVALLVALLGLWIVGRSVGLLGLGLGLGLVVLGLGLGLVVLVVSIREWIDHRARVEAWHALALESYRKNQMSETIEHVTEWTLTIENPAHVLLAALTVHLRQRQGNELAHSTRQLAGPIFLAGRRVGDLSKMQAESMSRQFARLGLIEGRSERIAGEWVPQSADEIITLVTRNW